MTKDLQDILDDLWEKHGHPDRHGYKDWMSPQGFEAAAEELLKIMKMKSS